MCMYNSTRCQFITGYHMDTTTMGDSYFGYNIIQVRLFCEKKRATK